MAVCPINKKKQRFFPLIAILVTIPTQPSQVEIMIC